MRDPNEPSGRPSPDEPSAELAALLRGDLAGVATMAPDRLVALVLAMAAVQSRLAAAATAVSARLAADAAAAAARQGKANGLLSVQQAARA